MSPYGSVPHIIGSEEYNHDNNCGLAGNSALLVVFQQNPYAFQEQIHQDLFCLLD
jgi:hypothetical protein